MKRTTTVRKITFAGLCLALALVLPFLTGQIPEIGQALSPMHLPALLCGFVCGPIWGAVVGFTSPILRSLIFLMPQMPAAIPMAFEIAVYGLMTGVLYRLLPKKLGFIYVSLIGAMISGRIVWGLVKWTIAVAGASEFGFAAFIAGAVTGTIPAMIVQVVLIPLILIALRRAGFIDEDLQ